MVLATLMELGEVAKKGERSVFKQEPFLVLVFLLLMVLAILWELLMLLSNNLTFASITIINSSEETLASLRVVALS